MRSHISYSELKTWNECAYKHKLIYIDEVKKFEGNEHTAFGSAVHEVCEKAVLKQIKTDTDSLKSCFSNAFLKELTDLNDKKVKLDKKLVSQMRVQVDGLLEYVIPQLKNTFKNYEVISAEERLFEDLDSSDKKYKGYIDLVLKTQDGRYHIIDWKTCSWGWDSRRKTEKIVTYQLSLYKYFFGKKHNVDLKNISTHFALLKRTAKSNRVEIFEVANGEKKVQNSLKLLDKAIYNIKNDNFIKNKLSCTAGYGCEFYNTKFCSR